MADRLPNEILQLIFGYCVDDIVALDQTSSAFRAAANYDLLWKLYSGPLYAQLGLLTSEITALKCPREYYYTQKRIDYSVKSIVNRMASCLSWMAGQHQIAACGIHALHGLTSILDSNANGTHLRQAYIAHELLNAVKRKRILLLLAQFAQKPDNYDVIDLFRAIECSFSSNLTAIHSMVRLLTSSYCHATGLDPQKLAADLANHVVLIMNLPTLTGLATVRMEYRSLAQLYTVTVALREIGYSARPWIQDCGLRWTGIVEIATPDSDPFFLVLTDTPETMPPSQFHRWAAEKNVQWVGLMDASCAMIGYLYGAEASTTDTLCVETAIRAIYETKGAFITFKPDSFEPKNPDTLYRSGSSVITAQQAIDCLFPNNPIVRVPVSPLAGCVVDDSGRLGVVISEQDKTVEILGDNGSVSRVTKSFCRITSPRLDEIRTKFSSNWVLLGKYFSLYDSAEFL